MDPVAVEKALQSQSITVAADEAVGVCEVARRLNAVMDDIDRSYAGLLAAPTFAGLNARGETGPVLLPDQQGNFETARDGIPQYLAHVEQAQAATNAFILTFAEQALQAESKLVSSNNRAPLAGVAFAYKDVFVPLTRWPTVGVGYPSHQPPESAVLFR